MPPQTSPTRFDWIVFCISSLTFIIGALSLYILDYAMRGVILMDAKGQSLPTLTNLVHQWAPLMQWYGLLPSGILALLLVKKASGAALRNSIFVMLCILMLAWSVWIVGVAFSYFTL